MKVSIVTTVRNRRNTIADTIRGILSQTHSDWEHIVTDAASTDDTLSVVRGFESEYAGRLKILSAEDRGIYDGINRGIREASGDILVNLNSDDFYLKEDVLARAVEAFEMNPDVDVVYGDVVYVEPDDLKKVVRYSTGASYSLNTVRFGIVPPHASFFVRRKCFEQFGCYDPAYEISGDFELEARFLYVNRLKSVYLPFPFAAMRMGGKSTGSLSAHWTAQREVLRACRENGIPANYLTLLMKYAIKIPQFLRRMRLPDEAPGFHS